jgi:hypothetical protein
MLKIREQAGGIQKGCLRRRAICEWDWKICTELGVRLGENILHKAREKIQRCKIISKQSVMNLYNSWAYMTLLPQYYCVLCILSSYCWEQYHKMGTIVILILLDSQNHCVSFLFSIAMLLQTFRLKQSIHSLPSCCRLGVQPLLSWVRCLELHKAEIRFWVECVLICRLAWGRLLQTHSVPWWLLTGRLPAFARGHPYFIVMWASSSNLLYESRVSVQARHSLT